MKRTLFFLSIFFAVSSARALEVTQNMQTTIGIFDACEQSLTYRFAGNQYDMITKLKTTGVNARLWPASTASSRNARAQAIRVRP